jgi:hypothetical protein
MSKPNPNSRTLTLLLKWGCEDYRHLLRIISKVKCFLKEPSYQNLVLKYKRMRNIKELIEHIQH